MSSLAWNCKEIDSDVESTIDDDIELLDGISPAKKEVAASSAVKDGTSRPECDLKESAQNGAASVNGREYNQSPISVSLALPSFPTAAAKTKQDRIEDEIKITSMMKISELKSELESKYGISTKSFLEKSEMVRALAAARVEACLDECKSGNGSDDGSGIEVIGFSAAPATAISFGIQRSSATENDEIEIVDSVPSNKREQKSNSSRSANPENVSIKSSVRNLNMVERLNTKQSLAYDIATRQRKSIFITGPAGTGKSVLLKHIMSTLKEKKIVWAGTSSTGTTAVALGGETLHHFAGCGVPSEVKQFERCWGEESMKRWRSVEALIVDEISMLSGEFLDHLNDVVKQIRKDQRAFGGIQLIICGDFLQLPPIPRKKTDITEMMLAGKSLEELHCNKGFAFQSKFWEEANFETIILDEVFRQRNHKFIEVLHEIRKGTVSEEAELFLRKCQRKLPPTPNGIKPTKLYSRNADVTKENSSELAKLDGKSCFYKSADFVTEEEQGSRKVPIGVSDGDEYVLTEKEKVLLRNDFFDQCMSERTLELKVDAQVMLIQNFSCEGILLYANGSRGKVVGFSDDLSRDGYGGLKVMEASDSLVRRFKKRQPERKMVYTIVEFMDGERIAIGPRDFECHLSGVGFCHRVGIPLKLAWAISIHKSQGMTLDYVKADLKGVFSDSQVYVALSRASNENGLELLNFKPSLVKCDWRALKFYEDPAFKFRLWNEKPPTAGNDGAPPPANPGALQGLSIVFTGELGSLDRVEAESLVKACGGVVRGSVSGKTNLLVVGTTLEDGREVESTSKYKKAKEIVDSGKNKSNLRIVDRQQFFELVRSGGSGKRQSEASESNKKKKLCKL